MANLRDLKKEVRYACGELAAECMIAAHYVEGVDPKAMSEIVGKIASLQGSALSHVSFSFDKTQKNFENRAAYLKARKEYFKKAYASFREKFNEKVVEIVRDMNAALPQSVKDANVAAMKK